MDELNILKTISKHANVAEGPESIHEVLLHLYREKEIKNKKLSQLTQIPVPTLTAIRGELIKEGILETIVTFTKEGREFVENRLGFKLSPCPINENFINDFSIKEFPDTILSKIVLNQLRSYLAKRPESKVELDQSMATFETQIKRLAILLMNGDIEGRSILLLGDDDATSTIISATGLAKRIMVLDIDERILKFVSDLPSELQKTQIETYHFDLRNPLPEQFERNFDVIFTDPPYTLQGAKLFFQRGSYALRNEGTKFYLSFGPKQPFITWNLQLQIQNSGFNLWKIYHGFNKYKGNLRLGQFSNLFIFKLVHSPELLSTRFSFPYNRELYTSEVRKSEFPIGLQFDRQKRSIGYHIIAEMYELKSEIIFKPNELYKETVQLCLKADLQIVDSYLYMYAPFGVSIVIALKESHIGLHTWPEHDYLSLDVFICDEPQKAHTFVNEMKKLIKPEKVEELVIDRGVNAK